MIDSHTQLEDIYELLRPVDTVEPENDSSEEYDSGISSEHVADSQDSEQEVNRSKVESWLVKRSPSILTTTSDGWQRVQSHPLRRAMSDSVINDYKESSVRIFREIVDPASSTQALTICTLLSLL